MERGDTTLFIMIFSMPGPGKSMQNVRRQVFALVIFLVGISGLSEPRRSQPRSTPADSVLILYDASGPYGWIGGIHARMLANLLGHFQLDYGMMPVETYRPGFIGASRATFYLGSVFNNPLPPSFLRDVLSTDKPVCWFKYNLWQVARDSSFGPQFEKRSGFRFDFMDSSGYETISYKGETFAKNPLDAELGRTVILDPGLAAAPAFACGQTTSNCIPYIVHGGNFWYVADAPFAYISEEDRYVIFADVLHDVLQISHPERHRALIRLEDIDPTYPTGLLRQAADYLHSEGVPFLVSVIPVYRDPLGYYNNGVAETVAMSRAPEFVQTLKHLVAQGGQIVLEGYTHQYDSVPNPYTGATGDDYEFFRVTVDEQNNVVDYMPVPEDSRHWVQNRIRDGLRQFRHCGLTPSAWQTPHYAASALDYAVFADYFPLTIQRVLYFDSGEGVLRGDGSKHGMLDSASHSAGQFFPYPIQRDFYGQKIAPENLGNIELVAFGGSPTRLPADLIRVARKNLVVRDGWASAFFHPFLDLSYLQELIRGVKALGYTYVPLSDDLQ